MGSVRAAITLYDGVTSPLQGMHKAMGVVLNTFEAMQHASGRAIDTAAIREAREEWAKAGTAFDTIEENIRQANNQQQQLNKHIGQGTTAAGGLLGKIKSIASAYLGMKAVKGLVGLSDTMTQTTARLNMMNDGRQTTTELNDMIYASAQRSRGSYLATADAVAKLGLMAGDAFSSNAETIAFMEQVNKQFKIAGTSAQGIDAAMLQLTQAMGSGVLRGEEYNSVLEQAPNIIQAIAKYMDVPKGKLKEMAADGQITADIIKAAMFACADETNAKFERMPKTWSDIWTSMKNRAIKALNPLLAKINDLANSARVQRTVDGLITAFSSLTTMLAAVFDGVCAVYNFVADNWSWMGPIIMGVVGALLVYKGALLATKAATAIAAGAKAAYIFVLSIFSGAAATAQAAQWGLNAAMYANPAGIVAAVIILLLIAFVALWETCDGFRAFWADMWKANMDAAGWAWNKVLCPVFNWMQDAQISVAETASSAARWMVNAWFDVLTGVTTAVSNIIKSLSGLVDVYNKISGALGGNPISVSMVDSITDDLEKKRAITLRGIDAYEQGAKRAGSRRLRELDLDAWHNYTSSMSDKIRNFTVSGWLKGKYKEITDGLGFDNPNTGGLNPYGGTLGDIAKNTAATADALDIAEEDLAYLRDIAERDAINRFTTAEIKVEQHNENHISSEMDIDGIMDAWTENFAEQLAVSAEGVHE